MLGYLDIYFDNRLLPREPEEAAMMRIILSVQNILEYESELAIAVVTSQSSNPRDHHFQSRIKGGYVTFKSKYEWLLKKNLILKPDYDVMDVIREIRNEHVHWRPSVTRRKLKYFETPLLTRRAVKQMLLDAQPIVVKLRVISGSREVFGLYPPGYWDEVPVP